MAAEMSCLTGVDAEDKDADPEINALTLMQEPLRMTSCTDAFNKSLCQSNSVLDVLSSEDMLSPVGLGNGPSLHQPTEAHELNSFSNDKEEEKNITPLKTVQEIGGMWDFDIDSPENSSDNFNSRSNISWDSPKDFMQFLWDSQGDSPGEEPKEEAPPSDIPKRRKRKMDMVVMVDPSEELFPPEDEDDDVPIKKVRKPKMSPSRLLPSKKMSKYTNGTVNPINILCSPPTTNSQQNSIGHELSPLKSRLTNSYSDAPEQYPCSKCKLVFEKQHLLDYHMKSHSEQLNPYVCKECGKSFKKSGFLIEHTAVHKQNLHAEKKSSKDKPQVLYCPQCSFGTKCPNEFVQHAKTHQKDKRKIDYKCEKCNFKTDDESFLKKHKLVQHAILSPKKPEKETFTCNICYSYKTFSQLVFKKHLLRRHDQSLEEYEAEHGVISAQSKLTVPSSKFRLKDAVFTSKMSIESQNTSKRVLPTDSKTISDFFKDSSVRRGPKLLQTESKLNKSIKVFLSRPRQGTMGIDQRKETNGNSCEKDPYELPESPLSQNDQVPPENDLDPSLSKRKISSPCYNTSDEDSKPSSPKRPEEDLDSFKTRDLSPFRDANPSHIDSIFKRQKQIIYTYSRRMSMRGALQASKKLYEKIKSEEHEQSDVEIKDEDTDDELVIERDSPKPQNSTEDVPASNTASNTDRKNCPYCSAFFESGVGLANHIRGHLHRIGLKYKAHNRISAEQVATTVEKQRVGPRFPTLLRKKEPQKDTDSETVKIVHSCPLCGDIFDNRTGQANHIRGHLKKLGKGLIAKHRSPLLLLRELMRDKEEYKRALEIIGKNNHVQYRPLSNLSDFHSFTPRSTDSVKDNCTDAKPLTPKQSFDDIISEKGQLEGNSDIKNSFSGNSALIGILKKRKCQEDSKLTVSSNSVQSSGSRLGSSLPYSVSEKDGFKRKTCIHCNASFHSGVSLSNHLRACARRKKNALPDNTLDSKVRRQRMRPGPKKKMLPLPHTPEEIYRLTCRFCDLVFQGPLSVQEDWVKHLQRHMMNTSVPHTGLAMVEVSSVPKEPRKYEHDATSAPC